MNQLKQKKSICFFLMICMLFLGMCVENIQADSFFLYESSSHTASTLLSGKRTTLATQEYQVETISREDFITSGTQNICRSFSRNSRGTALSLLFVDILPQISPIIFAAADCELTEESSSSTVIVSYIHHKDGKKA